LLCASAAFSAGCGTTIEIPSISVQLPGSKPELPMPALKLPDLKTQDLIAKIDEARRSGGVKALKAEAATLKTMFASTAANEFLSAVDALPVIASRKIYFNEKDGAWLGTAAYDALARNLKSQYKAVEYNEDAYYQAHFQSPLMYARALDVANLHGLNSLNGIRILDVSYGAIAAPRLMAASGATVVAIDAEPALAALYALQGDYGVVSGANGRAGSLKLATGVMSSDAAFSQQLGSEFDLVVVVDIPKRRSAESKRSKIAMDNKSSNDQRLRTFANALKSGGLLVMYHVGARDDNRRGGAMRKPQFTADEFQEVGLKVLAYEQNDNAAARQMGQLLRLDRALEVSERDLVASYTVLRK
jgi:hypothetical protein